MMFNWKTLAGGAAVSIMATAAIVQPVQAQVTTSSIRGTVTDASGAAASGVTVTIRHTPSGTVSTATTNADGVFSTRGLRVGGPYTVTATSGAGTGESGNIFLQVNETYPLSLSLGAERTLAAVTVTGTQGESILQTGPRSSFDLETIEALPSISRDVRDIARLDPLVSVDATNEGAISIAGTNNRFNSLTIDGIKFNDLFGLNANGFPSQRSPISVDALGSLSVEAAPYDVEFSGFSGGTVNILTKSGENEFHGSAYYFKNQDSWAGKTFADPSDPSGRRTVNRDFSEKTWGVTLGGPIIQDKLFFFIGYEKLEESASLQDGPLGSGAINEAGGVPQAEYDNVRSILQNVYNFDPGDFGSAGGQPVEDEKLLATLDWNINQDHRAKFTFIRNQGNEIQERNDNTALGSPSTWYDRAEETDAYAGQIFSDWSPNFSTEAKVAYTTQKTSQESLMGSDFANFHVTLASGDELSIGPDFFRHANALDNELWQFKFVGTYLHGDHTLKFGVERDEQDTVNLFVPGSEGTYDFDSVADLQNQIASSLFYQNAISNDENDGAADWGFSVTSLYAQDEFTFNDQLTLTGGLRYEFYGSSGTIAENANFMARYGFTNTSDVDGLDILLPRLGFNYAHNDMMTVRGGFGRFSGGSPAVWLSNNYSNTGVGIDNVFIPGPINGVDGFNIPAAAQAALTAGDGDVNVLDPNFKIPSLWRANLGIDFHFDEGWLEDTDLSFDFIHGINDNALFWKDISCDPQAVGGAPDNRPIYNCGIDPTVLAGLSTQQIIDYYDNGGNDEIAPEALLLTNIDKGHSNIFTVRGRKGFDSLGLNIGGSYTWQDITDGHSGTSSTATSNYSDYASRDRQNPLSSTSNFQRRHEFKLFVNWEHEFVDDYPTRVALFGTRRSGQPFSYTFDYSGGANRSLFGIREGRADDEGELFYVPTGASDPLYDGVNSFGGDMATQQAFFDFLAASGLNEYAGGIAPRNAFSSRWYSSVDLRFQQELPGLRKNDRTIVYVDIENLGNLIDNDWGRLEQVRYEYFQPVANVDIVNGQYVYSGFPERSEKRITEAASLWQIQLGIKYAF